MKTKNKITKYAIIGGFVTCSIFPILVFSKSIFCKLLKLIADFGQNGNQLFWNSAKKISLSVKQASYFQTCSRFSFQVSSKLIITLFAIYMVGLFINGTSVALGSQIYSKIIFSILMMLLLSFLLMILTFISSLIIVKTSQNPQKQTT